ncbi:MAG: N-acetyl-gamma-glutamyl-phosphate reductase [Candidatus Micrarchaeota archaeon]|nr:N-acetyl-gamma-glutamyl-phosphate reductase [Candidatus Micrarchaeota archaeon]
MLNAGVLGASGYSGNELVELLSKHKKVKLAFAQSRSNAGKKTGDIYPGSKADIKYTDPSMDEINGVDLVFTALPREEAAAIAPKIKPVLIDLSPAHRFTDGYVYGLPEANFETIRNANRIANPGCYATACILGILPLRDEKLGAVAFDCKSGYSGGGRSKNYDYTENVIPYSLSEHYQKPEVAKFLKHAFSFTPHVVNAFRGLIATIHVFAELEDVEKKYADFYEKKHFVKVTREIPDFNSVKNTPYCIIGGISGTKEHTIIVSAIDNLLKGAASQAVENMNIRFGFRHAEGLA